MKVLSFIPLTQEDFDVLAQTASLKGLLQPFKGKRGLEGWASQCRQLRDDLIRLSARRVLAQARSAPFSLLPVQLAQQATEAGTVFLRWRNLDRSAMGVGLWEQLIASPSTPQELLVDLYDLELHRIHLNMLISLAHTMAKQAEECANKAGHAEAVLVRRLTHDSIPTKGKHQ
ncbi:DUF3158 family protein [Pseudomonas huaxiensis]|uniref:DUF3158 family protein n=1 Tax=Pseudomonas huaxiensis TaxID=2213017 RepID=UPI000DA6D78F|nr:DUF3158 family protein [Pseudomonas huaxiensis]